MESNDLISFNEDESDDRDVIVPTRKSDRVRKPTEKGIEYQIQSLLSRRRRAELRLTELISTIQKMLPSKLNHQAVKEKLEQVVTTFEIFSETHQSLQEYLAASSHHYEPEKEEEHHNHIDEKIFQIQHTVKSWMRELDDVQSQKSFCSRKSNLARSVCSKGSIDSKPSSAHSFVSIRERAMHEKLKFAELKTKATFMEDRLKSESEIKRINLAEELEKSRMKIQIFNEAESTNIEDFQSQNLRNQTPVKKSPSKDQLHQIHWENAKQNQPEETNMCLSATSMDRKTSIFNFESYKENVKRQPITTKVYNDKPNQRNKTLLEMQACSSKNLLEDLPLQSVVSYDILDEPEEKYHFTCPISDARTYYRRKNLQSEGKPTFTKERDSEGGQLYSDPATSIRVETDSISEILCRLLRQQAAPNVEIESFDGDPMSYHYFISSFKEIVEKNIPDDRGRLTRLINFTKGEARELIYHCIQLPSDDGYKAARKLLEKRFGDTYTVIAAYRKEISSWPIMKTGDGTALRKFYSFLVKFQQIASNVTWNVLENPDTICTLSTKVPMYMVDRWNRRVLTKRRKDSTEPKFEDFVNFVEEETDLVNDPLFSRQSIEERLDTREKRGRLKTFTIKTDLTDDGKNEQQEDINKCILCHLYHDLDTCKKYLNKTVDERSSFLAEKKLCYGCYCSISQTHYARTCSSRRICSICGRLHPTGLHGYQYQKSKEVFHKNPNIQSMATKIKSSISMCVVPVKLRQPGTDKEVNTYAMLDNCSQGTFIKEELLDELKISGKPTNITIRTLSGEKNLDSKSITDLEVSGIHVNDWIKLPKCFSQKLLPVDAEEIATPERIANWRYLDQIRDEICHSDDQEVGILIGANCRRGLEPIQIISSQNDGPYACRSRLGWCITGPLKDHQSQNSTLDCNRILVHQATSNTSTSTHCFALRTSPKENGIANLLQKIYPNDFTEPQMESQKAEIIGSAEDRSWNDTEFLKQMEAQVRKNGRNYVLPLPFKENDIVVPNNRNFAKQRLIQLRRKFETNNRFFKHYKDFIEEMIDKEYASKSLIEGPVGKTWYIPHSGVYDPNKPEKIRVVFDCSAEFRGTSLNQHLMSGPDLTNQLIGVLMRFRMEPVAFMADIEKMFYQVHLPKSQRSFLRFLWWENSDMANGKTVDYEMNVHLFGAASSPSCSNYALRKSALDNTREWQSGKAIDTIIKNFYVDDLLKSVSNSAEAVQVIQEVIQLCAAGGFNLTKFISNDKEVLQNIPEERLRKNVREISLVDSTLPNDKALGVFWNIEEDTFGFQIDLKNKPFTRRGMLSLLSSIYDPCGFAAPFILEGRRIIQQACQQIKGWDEPISESLLEDWSQWCKILDDLTNLKITRCFKPQLYGKIIDCSLHHFSDASETGYGQVSYLRLIDDKNTIHCSFIMGKSRVTPTRFVSMPRLELTAAVLSTKVSVMIKRELDLEIDKEFFWTDSNVVLGYIKNKEKRFKIFVANRIQYILDNTDSKQWRYVSTKCNPADCTSRGLSRNQNQIHQWFNGPPFLWQPSSSWPDQERHHDVSNNDPEIKITNVNSTRLILPDVLHTLETRISCWQKMKRIMCYVLRFLNNMRGKTAVVSFQPDVSATAQASRKILELLQKNCFNEEHRALAKKEDIKKISSLYSLCPFLDEHNLIRVGGRLRRSAITAVDIHPIVLSKQQAITNLIIKHCHKLVGHGGRGLTLNELRSQGFWVVSANSVIRSFINKCVECRKTRGKPTQPIMADLPIERTDEVPPFTYCGVDMFGPFKIKERRSELKRYAALFTCFNCRAIHIETTTSLDTDVFILALRRFIARRGNVRSITSDNGTNFVGASSELKKSLQKMDETKIKAYLLNSGADWIKWKRNPPAASNMGGVWERQIRSARAVLNSLLIAHGGILNDESLRTLMTEVEAIVNSRPLTTDTLSDVNSLQPLSPSILLTNKTRAILPPPGAFTRPDLYSRKYWRRVQYIADQFWTRWRKEFLASLQPRKKWTKKGRSVRVGDVVFLRREEVRSSWPMALVTQTHPDDIGDVRSVTLWIPKENTSLQRPCNKVIVLIEAESNFEPLNVNQD